MSTEYKMCNKTYKQELGCHKISFPPYTALYNNKNYDHRDDIISLLYNVIQLLDE